MIVLDSKKDLITSLKVFNYHKLYGSLKDLDYRFILPETKMNKNSLIPWLLTAPAGSELNLIMMKSKQMINFKVRLDFFVLTTEILLRNDRFSRLD